MRVSRLHHPVTALGPGRRIGLWVQGCTIGCGGCVSRDTWDATAGEDIAVDRLADQIISVVVAEHLDGVTISGGEPFEQADELGRLASVVRSGVGDEVDLLVYSGLRWSVLNETYRPVVDLFDAVIAEPFIEARPPTHAWVGSSNQRIIAISELGRHRYRDVPAESPALQVSAADGALWMIGIPERGALDAFERELAERGVELGSVSWRP